MTETEMRFADLVHYFIDTDRMHRTLVEERIGALKLHRSQHMMLRCIECSAEAPTQKVLSQMLGISTATVAVTAKKLESEGYITRTESETDSRCNRLTLTDKGKEILLAARDVFHSIDRGMFENIPDTELRCFSETLRKIQNNLVSMGAVRPCGMSKEEKGS